MVPSTEVEYSLFSYISNMIGLICDRFLLRFDFFFCWDKTDKYYANFGTDPILYFLFCILNKIESQTAKFQGTKAAFKFLPLWFFIALIYMFR